MAKASTFPKVSPMQAQTQRNAGFINIGATIAALNRLLFGSVVSW